MMSLMCGRRLAGAARRNAFSVETASAGLLANAIVRTLPVFDFAWMPPLAAKEAMNPILSGFVVTPVKPCCDRHAFVAAAVYGLLDPPPHAARTSTKRSAASGGSRRMG